MTIRQIAFGMADVLSRIFPLPARQLASDKAADQRALAAAYGCSQSTIWRLIHRQVRT